MQSIHEKMITAADNKLRDLLSDIDPFWIKWGYWKEMVNEYNNSWPLRKYDGSDWHMGRTTGINECMSSLKVVGWYLEDKPHEITADHATCASWHRLGLKVVPVYCIK